ncbi:hypothetical protein K435DRAFT_317987 [Dendrothele bispora CBS 962.96]|uniref:Uncharacterized protein n=1 Tax=Dendrothele bispora (strain CBS 962.96) TaxID=1314807 RepID=A0A4S8LGB8_DENBC|nr:hypothetical protein K435DRAFT_317987 [Dendrothele bispora CBS 962.96]
MGVFILFAFLFFLMFVLLHFFLLLSFFLLSSLMGVYFFPHSMITYMFSFGLRSCIGDGGVLTFLSSHLL